MTTLSKNIEIKGRARSDEAVAPVSVRALLALKNNNQIKSVPKTALQNTVHAQLVLRCMVLMG